MSKYKSVKYNELQLANVLLNTQIVPDNNTALLFIQNNLVFLNGRLCNNKHTTVFKNDFIQILVNIKYYLTYR